MNPYIKIPPVTKFLYSIVIIKLYELTLKFLNILVFIISVDLITTLLISFVEIFSVQYKLFEYIQGGGKNSVRFLYA